jgi:hypothetical protein
MKSGRTSAQRPMIKLKGLAHEAVLKGAVQPGGIEDDIGGRLTWRSASVRFSPYPAVPKSPSSLRNRPYARLD